MTNAWNGVVLLLVIAAAPAAAGEIPGLPPQLPPYQDRDFEIAFSNDFLGRGGSVDDFRTQQIIVSSKLSQQWLALVDHSILTLDDGPESGRVDQLSASLGYEFINQVTDARVNRIAAGFGVRSTGSFAGERMQNGFHRLIGSKIEDLPYVPGSSTDVTAWLDANHYRVLREAGDGGLLSGWQRGAWLRGGSLIATGGHWDNTAAAFAVASRPSVDLWFGVRGDWRTGYKEHVIQQTALAEDDISVVLGARFGALVVETVQQLNNNASYGQLRLVSSGRRTSTARDRDDRFGLEIGVALPDVQVRVAGRYRRDFLCLEGSAWMEYIIIAAGYGEPQYDDSNRLFLRSGQLDFGLELERPWAAGSDWLSFYAMTSAGWRRQSLITVNNQEEEPSDSVSRAILGAGAGFRISAAGAADGWRLQIQTGVAATLPVAHARLEIDGQTYLVQKAALNLLLGVNISFN